MPRRLQQPSVPAHRRIQSIICAIFMQNAISKYAPNLWKFLGSKDIGEMRDVCVCETSLFPPKPAG